MTEKLDTIFAMTAQCAVSHLAQLITVALLETNQLLSFVLFVCLFLPLERWLVWEWGFISCTQLPDERETEREGGRERERERERERGGRERERERERERDREGERLLPKTAA